MGAISSTTLSPEPAALPQPRARLRSARSIKAEPAVTPSRGRFKSTIFVSGHLLFAREEMMMAQAFDPETRQLDRRGRARTRFCQHGRAAVMSAHRSRRTGRSSMRPAAHRIHRELIWFDRAGADSRHRLAAGPETYHPALSPDEKQVAVALRTGSPQNLDIWTIEIARNSAEPRDDRSRNRRVTPCGRQMVLASSSESARVGLEGQQEKAALVQTLANGTGANEALLEAAGTLHRVHVAPVNASLIPTDWSAGRTFRALPHSTGHFR